MHDAAVVHVPAVVHGIAVQRIALGIAYQGGALHGWQRQSNVPSVQQYLEAALSQVAAEPIVVQAAGRTDAGVHAMGQVTHFDTNAERSVQAWVRGVNSLTPPSLAVQWVALVDDAFHARFTATQRRYWYLFCDGTQPVPGLDAGCWHSHRVSAGPLDAQRMHQAAQHLVGEQDFTSFRGAGCQAKTALRRVNRVVVRRLGELLVLDISANAFLLHMVRNIAGALAQVGRGEVSSAQFQALLAGRDRTAVGPTAPPQGLYLMQVTYPGYAFPAAGMPPLLRAVQPSELEF